MGTDLEALSGSAQPMAAIFLNSFGVRPSLFFALPCSRLRFVETANIGTVVYRGYRSVRPDFCGHFPELTKTCRYMMGLDVYY